MLRMRSHYRDRGDIFIGGGRPYRFQLKEIVFGNGSNHTVISPMQCRSLYYLKKMNLI